jgi:hypothetical protein
MPALRAAGDPALSLQTRIDQLHRRIEADHGQGTYLFMAVYCNGCGRSASAPTTERLALLLEGWRIGDEFGADDYCPRCH